jgi:hypothetical protein
MEIIGDPPKALLDAVALNRGQWPTLEPAVRWALNAGAEVDVIAQDEYTHDLRIALSGGCVVLDST